MVGSVYNGSNRRKNITGWALGEFQRQYEDASLDKWSIFYYVYAVLHVPEYRQRYAENLKRDLPRIPFVEKKSFYAYVEAGTKLAKLHRDYEQVQPFPLVKEENRNAPFSWLVRDKMKFSSDKTSLEYNDCLTLSGIPVRVYDYKLGNRSALEWIIDQYYVSTDPNDPEQPGAIVKLIGQVIQVSLDTLDLIENLPPLGIATPPSPASSEQPALEKV